MPEITLEKSINVRGTPLQECSTSPLTGFLRDGYCNTCKEDVGSHTVCIKASKEFLEYSRFAGNDLSTPHPNLGFSGIRENDGWCLCASRWLEAEKNGMAPKVFLDSTHIKALDIIPLELLLKYAAD